MTVFSTSESLGSPSALRFGARRLSESVFCTHHFLLEAFSVCLSRPLARHRVRHSALRHRVQVSNPQVPGLKIEHACVGHSDHSDRSDRWFFFSTQTHPVFDHAFRLSHTCCFMCRLSLRLQSRLLHSVVCSCPDDNLQCNQISRGPSCECRRFVYLLLSLLYTLVRVGSTSGSCGMIGIGSGRSVDTSPGFGSQGVPRTLCNNLWSYRCSSGERHALRADDPLRTIQINTQQEESHRPKQLTTNPVCPWPSFQITSTLVC